MKPRKDRSSDTADDFSFFDRFGQKEQTGLGGRSKVTAPSPTRQQLSPIPYSEPYHSIAPATNALPPYFSPGPQGSQLPQHVSRDEAMLLMGLQPGNLIDGTFRTSAVLKPMPSVAKRRVVDFRDTDDDGNFFGELDRLRHSNVSQFGDTNVYGTPLRVVAAREAELRKRPAWDVDPFTVDQVQGSPSFQGGLVGVPRSVAPQEDFTAISKYRAYAQPDPPAAGKYGNQPITGSSSSYSTPPRASRGPQRMEPLATQEADEIQRQLQGLKRDPILVRGAFAPAHGAASPLSLPKELSPQRLPPLSTSPPPMQHNNKDVLNVPGGMYSHQIPRVVQGVLYGPSAAMREGGVKVLNSPQAKKEVKHKRDAATKRGKP